jgi:NAD+ synthase (glutamine-hydrolysing)
MSGCEIIGNSSGSHFQINKQERRFELILNSSKKNGGVFIYSNLIGCDGGRLYFDGGSFVSMNGKILSEGQRFGLDEVEITTATIDLNEISTYRNSIKSRCAQASQNEIKVPIIEIDDYILNKSKTCIHTEKKLIFNPFYSINPKQYSFEQELKYAPGCWLWDYLRRSGASGYFLAFSGGADSSCVAVMVSFMCKMIFDYIVNKKNMFVLQELRKIIRDENKENPYYPQSPEEICNLLFVTTYMGTQYSSKETRANANNLSKEIGAHHLNFEIDKIINAFKDTFTENLGKEFTPRFLSQGGTYEEDLALQNIQARIRMVLSYMIASLVSWTRKRKGFLLVLASGNLDEGVTGYLTKYDCSSADLNPIGSISKIRLKKFLSYCLKHEDIKSLEGVLSIAPSAELRPQEEGKKAQTDEEDIGITYEELSLLGQLRKDYKCGPYSMFRRLQSIWKDRSTEHVLNKVKLFFRKYAVNRHKMTTITPSLHCESYSLDDNRYDLRQFLYNSYWTFQFNNIDKFVKDNENYGIRI